MDVMIAGNPQISVSVWPAATPSSISPMATHSVETIWIVPASAQPRQASADPYTLTPVASVSSTCIESDAQATLFTFENTPTSMVSLGDVNNDYGDDMGHRGDDHHGGHNSSPGSLSPGAEHALISVGSIGGFIIVCFVFWMAWRMIKKSKRKADGIYGTHSSTPNPLSYFGRNPRGWQGLEDTPNEMLGSSTRYEKTTSRGQASEVYLTNDPRSHTQLLAKQGPTVLPQLQTNLSSSNSFSPYSTPTSVNMQNSQMVSPSSQTSQKLAAIPTLETGVSSINNANPSLGTSTSPRNAASTYVTISPISTAQPGDIMGTMQTDRSMMAEPFYNQSEMGRQSSNAYDPIRRHVYRASELSSLSSGFGDGDIIIPPPAALHSSPPGMPRFTYQQVPTVSRKDSIANGSEAGSSNRDTIYTNISEDMPMRYRTVNSWVNQQTGRIQRAVQKANEDVPPVPVMPPEERYTMMMDDEEPRRPETVPVPVPALPEGAANLPGPYEENKEMNP
ncbi:hypothetical protein VMCG_00421 [Cytospora schulzeri]|uniref:Uncharacterized protein n=1 Tax=Cytospora schulzeri TaxID=448051 RepID=A0A423X8V7_9PEZI|nr:hypothetical protein VMCG_00421 [Valsa malicola]